MSDDPQALSFELELMNSKREALCALLRHGVSIVDACADLMLDLAAVKRWRWLGGPAHELIDESKGLDFRLFALKVQDAEDYWRRMGPAREAASVIVESWSLTEKEWRRFTASIDQLSKEVGELKRAITPISTPAPPAQAPAPAVAAKDEHDEEAVYKDALVLLQESDSGPWGFKTLRQSLAVGMGDVWRAVLKRLQAHPSIRVNGQTLQWVSRPEPSPAVGKGPPMPKLPPKHNPARPLIDQAVALLEFNAPNWVFFGELREALSPDDRSAEAKTLRQDLKEHPNVEFLGGGGASPQLRWRKA